MNFKMTSIKALACFCLLLIPFVCAADHATPALLVGHVKILQELKERFLAQANKIKPVKKKAFQIPTLAHINAMINGKDSSKEAWFPSGSETRKNAIEECRQQYKSIVDQVIAHEKDYCHSHYVFYHGQRSQFRLWQDVLKEIYSFVHIHCPLKEFEFFRAWVDVEKSFNANQFIDDYEAKKRKEDTWSHSYDPSVTIPISWDDHEPYLTKNMLCANLSFFGNFTNSGESSFWYFKNNTNIAHKSSEDLLKALWDNFGFDHAHIKKILALDELIKTNEGSILQILIPKNQVDKYAFICKPFGTPIRNAIDQKSFDSKKMRHTKISPILEKYIANPEALSDSDTDFDNLQARLLLSQDCIINPSGGVKIFRYTTVSDAQMVQFKKELSKLINQMLQDWVASNGYKKATGLNIANLFDRIKACAVYRK